MVYLGVFLQVGSIPGSPDFGPACYTQRQLPFESDTFNIFAGITRALSLLNKDEFIWGLPKSRFARDLIWDLSRKHDQRRNTNFQTLPLSDGLVSQMPFPTWSWASWCCGNSKKIDPYPGGVALDPCLTVFFSYLVSWPT